VINGHSEIASVLLNQKTVDTNTKDGTLGRTALIWACQNGHGGVALGVVKLLLAREDVEVNAKDNGGNTALMWACQYGQEGVVKLLLGREEVEVNAKDGGGRTALIWACQHSLEGPVKLLLAREEVEVNAKDDGGKTALMWTSDFGFSRHERIARLLLERKDIDVDAEDNDKNTALAPAVRQNRDGMAQQIRQFIGDRQVV
jgi:ankyrin repeat protein